MDPNITILIIAIMAAVSFAGAGYALLGPRMAQRDRLRQRIDIAGVTSAGETGGRAIGRERGRGGSRRTVQQTLREIENAQKGKKKRPTIAQKIAQANIELTTTHFIIGSVVLGIVVFLFMMYVFGASAWMSLAFGFAAGFGAPRWILGYLARKREKQFSALFVNAVDVVVRGVKSGLPVGECMSIIARESPDPLGAEFKTLVEGQKLGVTLSQGLDRMLERMPSAELNFFVIVLTIQQQTGGNLSEALGNLSNVLRSRVQMRAKIQAMSSEAKASAMIIGSLPFAVTGMIYLSSPDYISLLFTTTVGNMMLVGGGMWMSLGVFVMSKMINFDI